MNKFWSRHPNSRLAVLFLAGTVFGLAVFFVITRLEYRPAQSQKAVLGMTFSTQYAKSLKLDWRQTYLAMLDDLKIRRFRIPVYWDEVEAKPGVYDWSDYDWMLTEASKRGAMVTLAIGRKVPRWPECHAPGWAKAQAEPEQQTLILKLLKAEVGHFAASSAVSVWQVENEPLFQFGDCPPPDRDFLKQEIELVKSLDPARPTQVTDSGELSTWLRTATLADQLGISMYRLVWNQYLGELYWPVTPMYYTERLNAISPAVKRVIVSELQAEPWFRKGVFDTPLAEQFDSMSTSRLTENVSFAERVGVPEIYLWGGEWWYWLKTTQNHPEFWDLARKLYNGG
jgi:hypothetical protein